MVKRQSVGTTADVRVLANNFDRIQPRNLHANVPSVGECHPGQLLYKKGRTMNVLDSLSLSLSAFV